MRMVLFYASDGSALPSKKVITPDAILARKEELERLKRNAPYNSIIDRLITGDYIGALVLSKKSDIVIPNDFAIKAADEIARKCYADAFGCFPREERKGVDKNVWDFDYTGAAIAIYKENSLDEKVKELERYFKQKSSLSMR